MCSVSSEAGRCCLSFACRVDSLSPCSSRGRPSPQGCSGVRCSSCSVTTHGRLSIPWAVWVGKERHLSRESGEIVVGFGATALFDGRGLHTVVGTNDSLDVTLYAGLSPLTRIRGGHSPRQVTAQEKEAWTELYLAMFPEGWRDDQRRQLEQSTVRETYPAFGALSVDADGRIWIGDFAKLAELQRRWTVLGPEGRPIGALSLPVFRPEWYRFREGLSAMGTGPVEVTTSLPKRRHELLDVSAGRIAILRRGELAGEFIEVYEVAMPR